jgi:predicted acylesterase/phospholipase RssA
MGHWCVPSGGGKYGALQGGMLEYRVDIDKVDYDGFAGVSVGAILAAFCAQAGPKELTNYVLRYKQFWQGISSNSKVWKNWFPLREAAGLLYRDAFKNSKPLQKLLEKNISDLEIHTQGRKLRMGVTGYGSGEYKVITEQATDIWQWVAASAAFHGFLLPVRRSGDMWLDGGGLVVTPIKSAILAGATEIDVFLASPMKLPTKDPGDNKLGTKLTGLDCALRGLEMVTHAVFMKDLKLAAMYNKLVAAGVGGDKRTVKLNVYAPSLKEADYGFSLDFEPVKDLMKMWESGTEIAARGPVEI